MGDGDAAHGKVVAYGGAKHEGLRRRLLILTLGGRPDRDVVTVVEYQQGCRRCRPMEARAASHVQ